MYQNMGAAGAEPEGGGSWAEFVARTGEAVVLFAESSRGGTAPGGNMTIDQAAGILAQSIKATDLWLMTEGVGGEG